MLDSIRTLTDVTTGDEVRIAREDIADARQRRRLLEEARQRARDCIAEAQAEVEAIRAHALQEGYAQGVLQAAEDIAQALVQSHALAARLRADLTVAAEHLLRSLLLRDELLEGWIAHWLAEQQGNAEAVLQMVLPERCKPQRQALGERLGAFWEGSLAIDYHPDERYLLRLADQVIELDVEQAQERLAPRLLAQLAALPPALRSLDQASARTLTNLAAAFASEINDSAEGPLNEEIIDG